MTDKIEIRGEGGIKCSQLLMTFNLLENFFMIMDGDGGIKCWQLLFLFNSQEKLLMIDYLLIWNTRVETHSMFSKSDSFKLKLLLVYLSGLAATHIVIKVKTLIISCYGNYVLHFLFIRAFQWYKIVHNLINIHPVTFPFYDVHNV